MRIDEKAIGDLIDGITPWPQLKELMSEHKDEGRFRIYLAVRQSRVPWKERILLPLGEHLSVVEKGTERIVKCDCGHEFGDYRENWKLSALIYVRDTEEKLKEVYPIGMGSDPAWMEIREFYCPGCGTQLEVEAVPPWYPIVFDFLPDIDAFYSEWLSDPLNLK